jgi:sec-independent protein translocase protein TatB
MFDISWTEFLLIGVVALIVIGPKELPTVLRTLGQWTRRVRSMAADFQNQFQEAMREAEMTDLKKQVDDIAHDIKSYDPLKDVRADVEAAGKDIQSSLEKPAPTATANEPAQSEAPVAPDTLPGPAEPVAQETGEPTIEPTIEQTTEPVSEPAANPAPAAAPGAYAREAAIVAAAIAPVVPEPDEDAPKPDSAGHGG